MKKFIVAAIFLIAYTAHAQTLVPAKPEQAGLSAERLTRVDELVTNYVTSERIPGAVVLIARNGKIVHHKAYGYSNIENKTPLKVNDIFRIASQTKAVTSLAAMMLFEEGKFLLDEPVSKYIPEFKNPRVLVNFNEKDSSYFTEPAKSEPLLNPPKANPPFANCLSTLRVLIMRVLAAKKEKPFLQKPVYPAALATTKVC